MSFFWCILIDLVLLWLFCGNWLLDYLLPRKLQLRRQLRMVAKNLRHRLRRDLRHPPLRTFDNHAEDLAPPGFRPSRFRHRGGLA